MPGPFGIDSALPLLHPAEVAAGLERLAQPPDWLSAMEDSARVRADLEREVPELTSGDLKLVGCKFKRAHVDDGRWTTLHRIKVENPEGEVREIDLHGVLVQADETAPGHLSPPVPFGSSGWHRFLPGVGLEISLQPADVAMPSLPTLADPALAAAFLQVALRDSAPGLAGLEITTCTPTVMRYREGLRCTIRYEIEYAPGAASEAWPDSVIAKIYEGDEGRATFEVMSSLWGTALRTSSAVTISEPLSWMPSERVLLQRRLAGDRTLKDHIKTAFDAGWESGVESLVGPVAKAGRGLAELHTSGATAGEPVTWDDQMATLQAATDQLVEVVPALAGALLPLVTGLKAAAAVTPSEDLVPTHRSFRPAQILLSGEDIAFLDFDGFCRAEPGLDLALFRTTLCDLALRSVTREDTLTLDPVVRERYLTDLDSLCATFLNGYREVADVDEARLALWDVLTGAKDILDCWRKVKFEHLDRRIEFLRRRLAARPPADQSPPASFGEDAPQGPLRPHTPHPTRRSVGHPSVRQLGARGRRGREHRLGA